MAIRLVVFDLDGTLIDSVRAHAEGWAFAVKSLGLADVDAGEVADLIGLPGDVIVGRIAGEEGLRYYASIRRLKDKHFLSQVVNGGVRPFPDAIPCLSYLKGRGYLLGLASSTPNYMLIPVLERLGLLDFFDYTVGGDEVLRGKPDPDIFVRVAEKARVGLREVAVVGDTEYDTVPARSVGMLSVLVARGRRVRARGLVADVVVSSLADLRFLL